MPFFEYVTFFTTEITTSCTIWDFSLIQQNLLGAQEKNDQKWLKKLCWWDCSLRVSAIVFRSLRWHQFQQLNIWCLGTLRCCWLMHTCFTWNWSNVKTTPCSMARSAEQLLLIELLLFVVEDWAALTRPLLVVVLKQNELFITIFYPWFNILT